MKKVDKLNETIAKDIARRIAKTGTITGTAEWQAKMVQHSNKLYDDVIKDVSKFTGESEKDIAKMFANAGVQCMKNDAEPLLKAGVLKEAKLSETAQQLLVANAAKCQKDINNLTLTTAVSTQNEFKEALNQAFLKVQSGAFSYTQAIMDAVDQLSTSGPTVQYASGYVGSLEAGVRTALMTAINQTASRITEMNAETLGAEYYEVSAHEGARPEHQVWQGKVFKIRGSEPGYPNFYEATGYGTGKGLGGYNCRHSFYPYFPEYSKRNWTDEQLEALNNKAYEVNGKKYTAYNYNQTKRRLQRTIKANNRKLTALRQLKKSGLSNAELKNEINRLGNTIKNQRKTLQYFNIMNGEIQLEQQRRLQEYYNLLLKIKGWEEFPDDYKEGVVRALAKAPKEIKKLWQKYGSNLIFGGNRQGGVSNGTEVFFDVVEDMTSAYGDPAYTTFFHEFGHCIDYQMLNRSWNLDKSRKEMVNKLREESRNNILAFVNKLGETNSLYFYKGYASGEYDSIEEMKTMLLSKAERLAENNVKRGLIRESEREKNRDKNYDILIDNEFDLDLAATSFFSSIKNSTNVSRGGLADISDMYEASLNGRVKMPLYAGHEEHAPGYWKDSNNAGNEAFAEMFSATVLQGESLKLIKAHFPNSYEIFKKIIVEDVKR